MAIREAYALSRRAACQSSQIGSSTASVSTNIRIRDDRETTGLELDAALRPNPLQLQRMLYQAHFGHQVCALDELRRRISPCQHHVSFRRPSVDAGQHLIDGKIVLLEGDIDL